jgi:hypothetical protein
MSIRLKSEHDETSTRYSSEWVRNAVSGKEVVRNGSGALLLTANELVVVVVVVVVLVAIIRNVTRMTKDLLEL